MANSGTVTAGNPILATEYNNLRKDGVQSQLDYYAASGSANAFTITVDSQYGASYVIGSKFRVKANHTITGASSLNASGIGAGPIVHLDGTPTFPGEIVSGKFFEVSWDGTSFQLMSVSNAIGKVVTSYTADGAISVNDRVSKTSTADKVEATIRQNLNKPGAATTIASTSWIKVCKVADRKYVAFYQRSSEWYAKCASVDPITLAITYGSEVAVGSTAANGGDNDVIYLSDDKVCFGYVDNANDVMMVIGTVSGTTITIGTPVTVYSDATIVGLGIALALINPTTIGIVYVRNSAGTASLCARAATFSGSTLTLGGTTTTATSYFTSRDTGALAACKVDTDKMFVMAQTSGRDGQGRVVSYVGTTPTINTAANFQAAGTPKSYDCEQIEANAVLLVWSTGSGQSIRRATISGTTVSYDTTYNFETAGNNPGGWGITGGTLGRLTIVDNTRAFIARRRGADGYLVLNEILLSSGTIYVQEDRVAVSSSLGTGSNTVGIALIETTKLKVAILGDVASSHRVYGEYDNIAKCVGVALSTVADGAAVDVLSKGKLTGFSGLTAGTVYYHDFISQTPTATNTGFVIGVAVDTDEIDVNCKKVPYSRGTVYVRNELTTGTTTGRQKVYHGMGFKPASVDIQAAVQDPSGMNPAAVFGFGSYDAEGERSFCQQGYVLGGGTASTIIDLRTPTAGTSSVATVLAIDEYSVTLNYTTHDAAEMDSTGVRHHAKFYN